MVAILVSFCVESGLGVGQSYSIKDSKTHYSDISLKEGADKVMTLSRGIQKAQQEGDLSKQLRFTLEIGAYYHQMDITDEALSYYLQALGLSKASADTNLIIRIHNAISEVYHENDMLQKAQEFNLRALNLISNRSSDEIIAKTYEIRAKTLYIQQKWYKALDASQNALKHFEHAENTEGIVRQWLLMASVYSENKLYSKALVNLKKARDSVNSLRNNKLVVDIYLHLASVYQADGQSDLALQYIEKGLNRAVGTNDIEKQEKLLRKKAALLAAKGSTGEALQAHRSLLDIRDTVEKMKNRRELIRLEVKYRTEQQKEKNRLLRKELAQQKEMRNLMVAISTLLLMFVIIAAIIRRYRRQRSKNKTLESFNRELERRVKEQTRELEIEIEERIKKTEEAENAKHKAEESDKLKTEFLKNISHEIRTPMNRITGYSDMLSETAQDEEEKEYATVIREDSERLMKLLNNIIDLSRLSTEEVQPDFEPVTLNEIFNKLEQKYARHGINGLRFIVDLPDEIAGEYIYTDQVHMNNLLCHLVDNAFKFTEQGFVRIGVRKRSEKLVFYVQDTGMGISREQVHHIFDSFRKGSVTSDKLYGGVGAGLTLAKYLTDMLGGEIEVKSHPGKGTIIRIFFVDSAKANGKKINGNEALENAYSWDNRKILVVDESESNVNYIRAVLEKTKASVIWKQNYQQAFSFINNAEVPDVVLINSQNGSSDEAKRNIALLKAMNYTMPVVLVTTVAGGQGLQNGLVDEVLTRPLSHKVLLERLSRILSDSTS